MQEAVGDPERYDDWMTELLATPLWSHCTPDAPRIPWRLAGEAGSRMPEAFGSPGLYMFGTGCGVPRYIGRTSTALKKRLFGRYLRGERCQCELAATYCVALREKGIDGFPAEIRQWYRKNYRGSTVRLDGAVDFARYGPEGIWFAIFPVTESRPASALESEWISATEHWNASHGHPPLLNKFKLARRGTRASYLRPDGRSR